MSPRDPSRGELRSPSGAASSRRARACPARLSDGASGGSGSLAGAAPFSRACLLLLLSAALGACASARSAPRVASVPRAAAPAPAPAPRQLHRVAAGETAYSIARRYGVTVEALARANRLEDPTKLRVGLELEIPASPGRPAPEPTAAGLERAGDDRRPAEEPARSPSAAGPKLEANGDEPAARPDAKGDRPDTKPEPRAEPEEDRDELASIEAEFKPAPPPPALCDGSKPRALTKRDGLIWPVEGVVISSFGRRDGSPHDGIDIAAPVGTPIWASREGRVLYTGERPGYGLIVILGHANDLVTVYAHNAKNCVADGARVSQGDVIGLVGESGDAGSPSLHFEVRLGQKTINPRGQLPD